jgi:hypothetical protein
MKLSNKHKSAIKSYLRAVAASGIACALAIAADMHPAYAALLASLIGPIIKAVDPTSGEEADYGINAK